MEELIALIVGLVGLGLLVLPVVSLVLATRARRRLRALTAEREGDEKKLEYLYHQVRELQAKVKGLEAAPPAAPSPATPAIEATSPAPIAATAPAEGEDDDTAPVRPADAPPADAPGPEGAEDETLRPEAAPRPAVAAAAEAPPAEPPPPAEPAEPPPPPVPLEERLATLFTRVGAGALVLGVLYFFKYAVDNEWIGPTGRVLAGVVVGLGVIVGAEVLRARTKPGFVHALSGVGLAILYVSAYASSAWYDLVSLQVAFGATAVILAVGAALSWRYRGEAILVLVLVAGLLTPKLLSTGEDRPFALFAYLFALTSVVLYVSVQRGFRIAVGLAVLGVHVMAIGWYGTFFEVYDLREEAWAPDRDPAELVGAYLELGPRIVPLAFAGLFGAQWMGAAFYLRRLGGPGPEKLRFWVVPLATVAAVFLHAAACALLYDRAPALGIAMVTVGAASVLVMSRLDATRWLMVPLAVAFLVLAGLSQEARGTEQTILLVLIGLWTAVYVVAFVKDAVSKAEVLSTADAARTQLALAAFAILACLMLLPDERSAAAAAAVTLAALPAAFVAFRAAQSTLLLIGQAVGLFGLLLVASVARLDPDVAWHPAVLGLGIVWGAAHVFAALRLPDDEPRAGTVGLWVLALGLLGPLAIGLVTTHEVAPTLRALLTAATGATSLGLASRLAGRGAARAAWTSTLSALSLGLFAAAIAFGLSGAPVTVLWAALAAIAGGVVARARTPVWLVTFQLLVLATGWRLAVVDIGDAEALTRSFYYSNGAIGELSLPVLFNPRAYALLGSGVAFLVGAAALAKSLRARPECKQLSRSLLLGSAAVVAVLGYGLLTTVAIWETRAALLDLPMRPPMALDAAEFDAFWLTVEAAREAHAATLDVATTVVLGLVGIALLAAGFGFNDPFHRYLGLLVLSLTIAKLVLWDVWRVSRIYRVVVLTSIGALLLISGFLYARLKVLFTKGSLPTGTSLLLMMLGAGAAHAQPTAPKIEAHRFEQVATVEGVGAPGDHRLVLPSALFEASKSAPDFHDVRLVDAEGHLVPFVVGRVPAERPSRWVEANRLDPGDLPDGGYRALFELPDGTRHCEVELELEGRGPFLRRTRIETGVTQEDLQTIGSGAIVYSVSSGGRSFGRSTVRYPESAARWVRVTLEPDRDARRTEIKGARFACRTPSAHPPRDVRALTIANTSQDPEAKTTLITLDAAQPGLPIDQLEVEVASPAELVRRVEVQSSAFEKVWPPVGSGVLYRVGGEAPSADLSVSVRAAQKRWFRVVISNGDDPPLEVTAVRGSWRPQEIIFRTSAPGPVKLYVGEENSSRPRFDLEDILARRIDRPTLTEVKLSEIVANPVFGKPDAGRALPLTERYRGPIGIGIAFVVLGLGLWALRLIRNAPTDEEA